VRRLRRRVPRPRAGWQRQCNGCAYPSLLSYGYLPARFTVSLSPPPRSHPLLPSLLPQFTQPTHQHTNTPTHQHTNTPTHQHTNTPTHQHTNTPTHPHTAHYTHTLVCIFLHLALLCCHVVCPAVDRLAGRHPGPEATSGANAGGARGGAGGGSGGRASAGGGVSQQPAGRAAGRGGRRCRAAAATPAGAWHCGCRFRGRAVVHVCVAWGGGRARRGGLAPGTRGRCLPGFCCARASACMSARLCAHLCVCVCECACVCAHACVPALCGRPWTARRR
jgi:hypothetical protein